MARLFETLGRLKEIKKETPELHHYTSPAGLQGILSNNTLWATHYSGLNDASEASMLRFVFRERLAEWLSRNLKRAVHLQPLPHRLRDKKGGPSADVYRITDKMLRIFQGRFVKDIDGIKLALSNPYILSFCDHSGDTGYERDNGLLSQWRGYGEGGGFCLVFNTAKLFDLVVDELDHFNYVSAPIGRVVYSDDNEAIEGIAVWLYEYVSEELGLIECKPVHPLDKGVGALAIASYFIKHRGFKEERELRLAFNPAGVREATFTSEDDPAKTLPLKPIKERLLRGVERPYIVLFDGVKRLPIKRIIVGPSRDQAGAVEFAGRLVSSSTPIIRSETPYVG